MRSLIAFLFISLSTPAAASVCAGEIFAPDFPACVLSNLDAPQLTLHSIGGSVLISDYLALFISLHKVPVHVETVCKSACIPLLMASPKPTASDTAILAVHFHTKPGNTDTTTRVLVQDTKEAWHAMMGNDSLWNHYITTLVDKGFLKAPPTEDFEVPNITPEGAFVERSFVPLTLDDLLAFKQLSTP